MDFLSAILGPVVESLLVPVKKHLGYLLSSAKHVRNMNTRMKKLHDTSVDVKKHMETNNIRNLEIPTGVPDWFEEVEKIKKDAEDAERISSNVNGCFNLKMRYIAGRKAFKTTQEIEALIKDNDETTWGDARKPLGKVSFKMASTSGPCDVDAQNYFKSREKIFNEALGLLQQDQKAQVIALCGMGGVGKTTMMKQLKKDVEDKKVFDCVVNVVIGQKVNTFSIQQTVAEYLGDPLTETSKTARADRLRVTFRKMSQESKSKVLVVLDDVWEKVELEDIGLSPLPNGFKLLLTSRNENVCTQIAIEANSDPRVVRVDVMEELEANNFFCHISKVTSPELKDIGVEIVRRCGFLPLAIKLIATNVRSREKSVWKDALRRLKENDLDKNVRRIIEMSYTSIAEEDAKAIFLLCGLFPDDFNIPTEDLTRYAWGLKLLKKVRTLGDARDRTKACVLDLKNANLLLDSDYSECVKMHDLVLAFVVAEVSKGHHPWIINHGDVSNWSGAEMSESCRRISLTCMGMSEFPIDFNYPNVSLLRLMNGDKSLTFPEDFYEKLENLQVMACEKLQYPLLPKSLQCSTKLQTLCLHECSLMFDISSIGDHLLNLEVLSFAHSRIRYLPSAIGKLKKLKLLDLTGCITLRIQEGVLKNLVKLEELYMTVVGKRGVRFTEINYKELEERSKDLSALEVEFYENIRQSKNMSYNKLERFKISMGRFLEENSHKDRYSTENTLMLAANKDELLESGMNELFSKTEVLHLAADGMNNLEEVLLKSVPQQSFYNLRVLYVSRCADLKYLFTVPVANGLVKLDHLTIEECPVMEALVYSENGEEEVIRFHKLKHLSMIDLSVLVGWSNTNNVIDLPQLVNLVLQHLPKFTSIYPESATTSLMSSNSSAIKPFFNKKVMIPQLEILHIKHMEVLKNIWPYGSSEEVDACLLREIDVSDCDNLVNVFPSNPMPLLHHLETIYVDGCGSLEVLFDIDIGRLGEIKECDSKLRSIRIGYSGKLREVWRLKGVTSPDLIICGFQAVERIEIYRCESFRNIFTPITARFDLGALQHIHTDCIDDEKSEEENNESAEEENNESAERNQEIDDISKGEIVKVADKIPYVAYPFNLLTTFHHLQNLSLRELVDVEVVFEIENETYRDLTTWDNQQPPILSHLESLYLSDLEKMNCVWKCNWNHFLYSQKQRESLFQNLKTISLERCGKIKYLFSPLMVKLLFNLKTIRISQCDGIEEVVSNRDDDIQTMAALTSSCTNPTLFPYLESLSLSCLSKLKFIHDGTARDNRNEITSNDGAARDNRNEVTSNGTIVDDECDNIHTAVTIPKMSNMKLLELPNLQILRINKCDLLEHVFTSSTLESLKQLRELMVEECKSMQVIVKKHGEHTTSKFVFPHLESLTLTDLPNIKGFFFGMNEIHWPQLDKVKIFGCPQMTVFTSGHSMTPKLNYMHTGLGKHNLECGLNFELTNASKETQFRSSSMCSTPDMIKLLQYPCSLSNLVEVDIKRDSYMPQSRILFPHNELHKLQNLENLSIHNFLAAAEEVFEVVEETNDDMNETQSSSTVVVVFPKLKEVTLIRLKSVKHIWKSNWRTVLNFPNLTKVFIYGCPFLGNVLTSCMVGSLLKLQELHISDCYNMEVIVEQAEDSDTRANEVVVFPCLKSVKLSWLDNLKGFYLGPEAFIWPSLDTLEIIGCPQITVFTCGKSTTPELKVIDTSFGLCNATEDPTSFIKTKQQEGWEF